MITKEKFTTITSNWDSHRPLLWAGLEAVKHFQLPILELGCGNGSTPFLREYCKDNNLELFSYDYNKEWADKFGVPHVNDWENIPWRKEYGLVLVDESPGEHRRISLQRLHHVKVVIAHDTEPAADSGYKMRDQLYKYRYMIDYETDGAWATAVSNFVNVTKFNI